MKNFVLTFLVGALVVFGDFGVAWADYLSCKRTTNNSSGFTSSSAFDSWFPKRLNLDDTAFQRISGKKSMRLRAGRLTYQLLPNGKLIAELAEQSGYKSVGVIRYKCDRNSIQVAQSNEDGKSSLAELAPAYPISTKSLKNNPLRKFNDNLICQTATEMFNGKLVWHSKYIDAVAVAKNRKLSCGVKDSGSTQAASESDNTPASTQVAKTEVSKDKKRGWLGVFIQEVTEDIAESLGLNETTGALVSTVNENSPAFAAGVEPGDVILKFDGKGVERMRDLPRIVAETEVGSKINVELFRMGKKKSVVVQLGNLELAMANATLSDDTASASTKAEKPSVSSAELVDNDSNSGSTNKQSFASLGMSVQDLDAKLAKELNIASELTGVAVDEVLPGSMASYKGLARGDIIRIIGNRRVESAFSLAKDIMEAENDGNSGILILVERDGRERFVHIDFAELDTKRQNRIKLEEKLAASQVPQQKQQQTISSDTQIPLITITHSGADGRKGIIKGFAQDNVQVAEVLINGEAVNVAKDGSFEWSGFVPASGKDINIEVFDTAALSSTQVIRLERGQIQQASGPRFDDLDPTSGRRVVQNDNALALIVGISDYKRTDAPAIYADKDAEYFHDYASLKLGIPDSNITTMVNDKAEQGDVILAVKDWMRRLSKPGKTDVYVFFAGHGLASDDGEQMYLLPFDGRPRLLDDTAIARERLFDDIASANPRSVTVFLDTCYSGTTRGTDMLIASRPIALKALKQSLPDNFTVMTAAAGDQTAKPLEEAKHGMFSYFLMKGMEGDADANQDNQITAGELHAYVQENVVQQSSGSQTPELQGDAERVLVRFQ